MENLQFHPLADLFPLLQDTDLDDLTASIKANGLLEPITLHEDGSILDGRNRYRACVLAKVEPTFRVYTGDDPLGFVVSLNLHRRHLNESQRGDIAAQIANMESGHRTDLPGANLHKVISIKNAAEMMNVSERTVKSARKVRESGTPELVEAVQRGEVSVSAAEKVARLDPEQQKEVVKAGPQAVKEAAKKVETTKKKKKKSPLPMRCGKTMEQLRHDYDKAVESARTSGEFRAAEDAFRKLGPVARDEFLTWVHGGCPEIEVASRASFDDDEDEVERFCKDGERGGDKRFAEAVVGFAIGDMKRLPADHPDREWAIRSVMRWCIDELGEVAR